MKKRIPNFDESKLIKTIINLPVQINGKFKKAIEMPSNLEQDEVIEIIKANTNYLQDKTIKEVIFIKNKIINLILN